VTIRLFKAFLAGIALLTLTAALIYIFIFLQYLVAGATFHYTYFLIYSLKKGLFVGFITILLFLVNGPRKTSN
jgi:hypothetical protein